MNVRTTSWLDRLVGACCSLLVAAAAIYLAARLVASVWVELAVIASVVMLLVLTFVVWRWWRRRQIGW